MLMLTSLALCAGTPGFAAEEDSFFLVVTITGTSPVSPPVSGLPDRYMREGDRLAAGSRWLFPPETAVRVKYSANGEARTINGPASISIGKTSIAIYGREPLTFTAPAD